MRNNDRILNSLYASSIITAGLAWIMIVILLGALNHSFLTGLLAGISCGKDLFQSRLLPSQCHCEPFFGEAVSSSIDVILPSLQTMSP